MFRRNVVSLQCDARQLPLPDESVDLIVTSPPYFALREYVDGGEAVEDQIGSEATPEQFLESLWACTEEWMRVLKPRGSIFVNLGDKWSGGGGGPSKSLSGRSYEGVRGTTNQSYPQTPGYKPKSLIGIPWRYAIGCIDRIGLVLREEVIWHKPNGLPESVKDRCRRSHEQVFHFTRQGDYYSAVDRIREPGGALPPSVWSIPTQPLVVPKYAVEDSLDDSSFEFDHFAAFPPALVQKIVDGWAPVHVCDKCGQGRFPVTETIRTPRPTSGPKRGGGGRKLEQGHPREYDEGNYACEVRVIGSACACTPYEDHPENRGKDWRGADSGDRKVTGQRMGKDFTGNGHPARSGGEWKSPSNPERNEFRYGRGPVREYLFDQWDPASTTPGVVLDPFGGTGTTAIVAAIMGRRGITCDLSADYAGKLVPWRMNDRSQMKSLLGSKK